MKIIAVAVKGNSLLFYLGEKTEKWLRLSQTGGEKTNGKGGTRIRVPPF